VENDTRSGDFRQATRSAPTAQDPQQMADLLRQQPFVDVPTWAVAPAWEARAARVCCDTQMGVPQWGRLSDFPAA
jgi:hypothetical protein